MNEHYDREQLKNVHQALLRRRKGLINRTQSRQNEAFQPWSYDETGELSHLRLHPADLATDTQEREILSKLNKGEIEELHSIEVALEKLYKGTFGICASCEREIDIQRLKKIPDTCLCYECSSDEETKEKKSSRNHFHENEETAYIKKYDFDPSED